MTCVDNYLDRAKSTVVNLIAAGLNPRVKCVMTPYNWEQAERIVALFSSLGARRFQFVQYGRSLYRHSDDLFLTREPKLRLSEFLRRLAGERDDLEIVFREPPAGQDQRELEQAWEQRAVAPATEPLSSCLARRRLPFEELSSCARRFRPSYAQAPRNLTARRSTLIQPRAA